MSEDYRVFGGFLERFSMIIQIACRFLQRTIFGANGGVVIFYGATDVSNPRIYRFGFDG